MLERWTRKRSVYPLMTVRAWQPAAAMSRPIPLAGCWPTSNPGKFDSVIGIESSIGFSTEVL